jgi:hypothetical protein
MGVAVKDQEQAEAEAEHSAGGTITDALTGYVDAELAAEGTLAHAQINASTSFSGTVMATAFTTLVGDWQDQDALFGSQVGASVGYTQSVVDASSRYLQAVNGIDDQSLGDADARKEAQLKSVLDAGVGLAMAGGAKVGTGALGRGKAPRSELCHSVQSDLRPSANSVVDPGVLNWRLRCRTGNSLGCDRAGRSDH